ncbi:MAG: twin-arginine translocation signal domain-containing protein, partial [Planctomycetales bacterium]|nr:twin-arginine translocation signal domain-containing protein [Planctomycetales bacterium]
MHPMIQEQLQQQTRRHFLQQSAAGIGGMALASMLGGQASGASAADPLAPREPHFPAKAKQVIYLHLTGSPPHL